MKLIDADALIDCFFARNAICKTYSNIDIKGVIEEQPEAVVRCRDCEYWDMPTDGISTWARCDFFSSPQKVDVMTNADGFCSDGVRKEDR